MYKMIPRGWIVKYKDAQSLPHTDNHGKVRYSSGVVILSGIWDGHKVVCSDKDQTTVFNRQWLSLANPIEVIRFYKERRRRLLYEKLKLIYDKK